MDTDKVERSPIVSKDEVGRKLVHQDQILNRLVQEAIFQPISAETNPFHKDVLAYINPKLQFTNSQYDFSLGVPQGLPYLLVFGDKKRHPDSLVYCRPENRRTGIITSSSGILMDGTPLNYLDEKGLGNLLENRAELSPIRWQYVRVYHTNAGHFSGKPVTWGGTDLDFALHDAQSCDGLVADGIRIVPTVAIVQIDKILNEKGEYVTIEEAKKQGLIAETAVPVVQFRAFVTPYRPKEFIYTENHHLPEKELQRRRFMLKEALADMSKDDFIPVDFSNPEEAIPKYLQWFAETFGQTVARLHKARKVHNWLHELHNITLDVRIIDSDGLENNASDRDINQESGTLFSDYSDLHCGLWKFYESIKNLFNLQTDSSELLTCTINAYDNELNVR